MKSRIWQLAGVGLLVMSVGAQALAEEQRDDQQQRPRQDGGQRPQAQAGGNERGGNEGRGQQRADNNPQRGDAGQGRGQGPQRDSQQPRNAPERPAFDASRPQNSQQRPLGERGQPTERQPWQARPLNNDPNAKGRPPQQSNNLPIQGHPDTVWQTQEPRRGNYSDIPRRNGYQQNWQGNNGRPGNSGHPDDRRWPGRPGGHGNGWGAGPQYRPGHVIERFPERNWRVPYRGQDYFYSGGYWYRPQGPRYVVVAPPRGIRVSYLPDYAREVWVGSSLFFLAAGAYYLYQQDTQDYVVVDAPSAVPQQVPAPSGNGYDVTAYPANGQSPQQVWQDGEDCRNWAIQQSGFDPTRASYAPDPSVVQTYRQAQGSCLSSRGYQVSY